MLRFFGRAAHRGSPLLFEKNDQNQIFTIAVIRSLLSRLLYWR